MPLPKKKVHARFNVGAMMSKLKEARERNALEHEKVLTLSRDLQSKQAKVRRLQQKVNDFFRVFRNFHFLCNSLDFLISGAVNIAATFHRFHNAKVLNSFTELRKDEFIYTIKKTLFPSSFDYHLKTYMQWRSGIIVSAINSIHISFN